MSYTDHDFPNTHFYDTDLREILCKVTKILKTVDELDDWKTEHEEEYKELKAFMDAVNSGDFPEAMINSMYEWMQENALDIVGSMIKHVHFGLTNDGYFCAFIPDNWSNIQFDTVTDFDDPLYGHLMLIYD